MRVADPRTFGNLATMFSEHLERWSLTPDGNAITTPTSILLPVRAGDARAMLKIAVQEEERRGGHVMRWWDGHGAARVFTYTGDAILMERAEERASLADMVQNGQDAEASRIICAVVAQLHAPRAQPPPALVPLARWFEPLNSAGTTHGGMFRVAHRTASSLLAGERDIVVLHGDVHHGNILDFGVRGWLAIDPKGLVGERSFDYANIFCNPNPIIATMPGRLARQSQVVAEAAQIERSRLLAWIVAWAGLSAAFAVDDSKPPDDALSMAHIAAAELSR